MKTKYQISTKLKEIIESEVKEIERENHMGIVIHQTWKKALIWVLEN